jgi:hypothetical protein
MLEDASMKMADWDVGRRRSKALPGMTEWDVRGK